MIEKNSVTQQVIDFIKENIKAGKWQMGEKIPSENELTRALGVSRVSVRMALQQFIGLGILKTFQGKGTFVTSQNLAGFSKTALRLSGGDYNNMRKMFEFRLIIEPETCRLAAERAQEESIARLKNLLDIMKSTCMEDDREANVRHDVLFHEEIASATGNAFLENSLRDVLHETMEIHKEISRYFGYKNGIYYHSLILQAIEARNSVKARRLMFEHMQGAIEILDSVSR